MIVTRRKAMQGIGAGAVALAVGSILAPEARGLIMLGGSAGPQQSGFLPAGHWMPAKQAMIQIYPRPDTETNTWARHRWAYYDGVNSVQYKIPIGVAFGAFPYVFSLDSASQALGMSFQAAYWNTSWTSFQQALSQGYGYLVWTPTASVSGHTVTITVTDQQRNTLTITFTVSTSSSTSHFIFLDATNGNDSTGTGTISAPWQTLTKALGASYSTSTNANTILYLRGTGTYAMPAASYSSGDFSAGLDLYEINTGLKPAAYLGFPGDPAPVINLTTNYFAAGSSGSAADLFMQGLAPNGYNASATNFRFVWLSGGSNHVRTTFDGNQWTNSGYGASAGSNATGYFVDTTNSQSSYHFINNCSETGRQSGNAGNNYLGCSFYNAINVLVQGNYGIMPTVTVDEAWQPKSDVSNGTWRGNTTIVNSCEYAYSPLQQVYSGFANFEACYNIITVATGGYPMAFPVPSAPGVFTNLWCYRNNVGGTGGINCGTPNANGPYVFQNNAVRTSAAQPGGSSVTTSNNLYVASGLLDSNGDLQSAYSSYLGTVGAQIA